MYNQNWHAVYGPVRVPDDVLETQLADAYMTVLRMSGASTDPGPEIVIYCFADQGSDGYEGNAILVTTQVGYEIREGNRDVNYADYEYESSDISYRSVDAADEAARRLAQSYADNADRNFDWTGDSPLDRTGGPVT